MVRYLPSQVFFMPLKLLVKVGCGGYSTDVRARSFCHKKEVPSQITVEFIFDDYSCNAKSKVNNENRSPTVKP